MREQHFQALFGAEVFIERSKSRVRAGCAGATVRNFVVQGFLELREPLVKRENFRGEGLSGSEKARTTNPRIVTGRNSLCGHHLRGAGAVPTTSLYHPG